MSHYEPKVGDLVSSVIKNATGVVVGFNKKGEGGKEFVHILVNGNIIICMAWDLYIEESKDERT